MIAQEVIEFIDKRFKKDRDWGSSNCYYFSMILYIRFLEYNPVVYYDVLSNHFLCKINNIFYDYSGAVAFNDEYISNHIKKCSALRKEDPLYCSKVIRDLIL